MERFDMFYNNQNRLNELEETYYEPEQTYYEPEQTYVAPRVQNEMSYTVQKGDNLYSIANNYGTTIEELLKLNNLESTTIYPNQVLLIPYQEMNGMHYKEYLTVSGDSLIKISEMFNVPPRVLMMYNDVLKLELAPEQMIKIPRKLKEYIILEEDTLNTILEKTGMTYEELMDYNQKIWLKPGATIIIK
ncbi:LysM peptidoglycan-binding domain-containing protein [Mycoplasmatota bacterium]|nr:LysM peptidoglycan-binding domain-containing protein [Mycoplasmatota bacterium]